MSFIQGDVMIDTEKKEIIFSLATNHAKFEFDLSYRLAKKIAEGILKQLEAEL